MQEKQANFFRFDDLSIHDNEVFAEPIYFTFDRQRTLIVGGHGTGKTTIVNALACIGHTPGGNPNSVSDAPVMSVNVSTSGNRELLETYGSLIFPGRDNPSINWMNYQYMLPRLLDDDGRVSIEEEVEGIFASMLERKPYKVELYKSLNYRTMAAGETVCHRYAFVFAVRKLLGLNLPIVIEMPYGHLDTELGQGFHAFINQQKSQLILLCCENNFVDNSDADYILKHA